MYGWNDKMAEDEAKVNNLFNFQCFQEKQNIWFVINLQSTLYEDVLCNAFQLSDDIWIANVNIFFNEVINALMSKNRTHEFSFSWSDFAQYPCRGIISLNENYTSLQ